jgi:hypothetical protein
MNDIWFSPGTEDAAGVNVPASNALAKKWYSMTEGLPVLPEMMENVFFVIRFRNGSIDQWLHTNQAVFSIFFQPNEPALKIEI